MAVLASEPTGCLFFCTTAGLTNKLANRRVGRHSWGLMDWISGNGTRCRALECR